MSIQLSTTARDSIRDFVSISVTLTNKQTKMVDALVADGITAEMCFAPKGDAPREFYNSLESAVVLGFSKQVQALIAMPPAEAKALSEQKKADRRYWNQQKGSKIKDIRNALKRRETSGPNGSPTTKLEMLKRDLESALKRAVELDPEKDSIPDMVNIPEMTSHIKQALVSFK